jgi:O-antigen ligase
VPRRFVAVKTHIDTERLLALRARDLWRFFASQNAAYWAICLYLFTEYVRPQQMWGPVIGTPLAQISLSGALILQILSGRGLRIKDIASWLMLAFTLVIVASSFFAQDPVIAYDGLMLWFSWLVVYFLITAIVDTKERFVFFLLLWMAYHFYMAQGGARQFIGRGFTFAKHGLVGAPGWFQNSGEFGIAMVMLAVVSLHFYSVAHRSWSLWKKAVYLALFPVAATLCVVGSSTRGAMLALGAVGGWFVLRTKYRIRALLIMPIVGFAVWYAVPQGSKERFSEMGTDSTSVRRLTYWKNGLEMAAEHPVLGVGYNNWISYYSANYPERVGAYEGFEGKVEVSHNVFIECVSQLGYLGLLVFVLLIISSFWLNHQTRKRARAGPGPPDDTSIQIAFALDGALIAQLVGGLFIATLFYPFFWVNLALTVALNSVVGSSPSASRKRIRTRVIAKRSGLESPQTAT